jgi:copper oxidase (laccase) domain-containing protein
VVGAAHAGWKGAFGGVAEATVAAMVALGARRERIVAAIGPCIAQSSYEVDEGFAPAFCAG